jgi:hypothetical protein
MRSSRSPDRATSQGQLEFHTPDAHNRAPCAPAVKPGFRRLTLHGSHVLSTSCARCPASLRQISHNGDAVDQGLSPNTSTGGWSSFGGHVRRGTAICTTIGISSVRSCTAAADSRHTTARGARSEIASRSGYAAADASARRNTPRDNSTSSPPSRAAYRSRGCTPAARAYPEVKVDGSLTALPWIETSTCQY